VKRTFIPRLDILPPTQQQLWPHLRPAARLGFSLYGGTAVARATSLQDRDNTWVMLVPVDHTPTEYVKLSFFGTIVFGRVAEPDFTDDGVLRVAALDDLMATKLKVVLQRAEAKDYRDIAAMIRAGVDLARGLASARLLFGPNFQPSESLKALVYFNDGDLQTLTGAEKSILVNAVKSVRDLPRVTLCAT